MKQLNYILLLLLPILTACPMEPEPDIKIKVINNSDKSIYWEYCVAADTVNVSIACLNYPESLQPFKEPKEAINPHSTIEITYESSDFRRFYHENKYVVSYFFDADEVEGLQWQEIKDNNLLLSKKVYPSFEAIRVADYTFIYP